VASEPRPTRAVDDESPIDAGLVADCVHCGFCLPTCPTYLLWGEEMDSPRGRIYLMRQLNEGEPLDDTTVRHFDQCLGCMACVTACPSGVQYDRLIEQTRAFVEREHRRAPGERALRAAVFGLFPYPRRLRALRPVLQRYQRSGVRRAVQRRLLRRLPPTVASMEQLLPPAQPRTDVPELTRAIGSRRASVAMLLGCVQREFFSEVNAATVRVLAAEGCDVVAPPTQGCCGALSLHAGRDRDAARFAKRMVESFEGLDVDAIVVNAAGCGSTMKDYAEVLRDEPAWAGRAALVAAKVRDVSELLLELGPVAARHPLQATVAYHDACHLAHAQGVRAQPRALLAGIPQLTVREINDPDICCGSAGVYNLFQPDAARDLGDRKAANVLATQADLLVTANPGCLMQIDAALQRMGVRLPQAHTVQVLDASIRGLPVDTLTG
jgi:glycolate oxidase iron-sulfur subunit